MNRLPFILRRWKGAISLSILVKESEVESLADRILECAGLRRIVFTVYVTKTITNNAIPFYVLADGTHLDYPEGFYPINTLRDLAIESISTTHLLVADMDVFPSMGLESSINEYAEVLRDHHNMIALTLFRYNNHSSLSQCYSERFVFQ